MEFLQDHFQTKRERHTLWQNQGVATPQNPAILLDRDDILMRSYSVDRAGLSTVQISVLPGFFCLKHATNGKSHRHFKNFSATFWSKISDLELGFQLPNKM